MNSPSPPPALHAHPAKGDRTAQARRPIPSALAQGVGVRLAIAGAAAAMLWITVGWALS